MIEYKLVFLWVDKLDEFHFFDYKLGFWFAQQGAILSFVVLIFVYIKYMNWLDKKYGVAED